MSVKFNLKSFKNWDIYPLSKILCDSEVSRLFQRSFSLEYETLKKSSWALDQEIYFYGNDHFLAAANSLELKSLPILLDFDRSYKSLSSVKTSKGDPFKKALDRNSSSRREVIDATGGILEDTLLMISWGYTVNCFEGNFIVQALIQNALKRVENETIKNRLNFLPRYFTTKELEGIDKLIVYDPFFDKVKEKTKTTKEMSFLRSVRDINIPKLEFKDFKGNKIILKRPLKALPLFENPITSYKGKSIRYDLYSVIK